MSPGNLSSADRADACRDPHLTLQLTRSGATTLVTVSGEVDADNAHLVSELVASSTPVGSPRVVLDLHQVTFLCAAGVEALLRVRDAVTGSSGQLILKDPSPIVLTVLAGTRVLRGFQIHTSSPERDRADRLPARRPGG